MQQVKRKPLPVRIFRFYVDGFKAMTVGRYLWAIILIKLFIIFFVLKLFFFPNILNRDYDNDADRASAVRRSMLDPARH
nr:DUF4492 domain-containing protein [Bacteroides sp.]